MYKTKVLATGSHFPKKIMTNSDLEKIVETSDEWIFERTGIRERRISDPNGGEYPTDLAKEATLKAIKDLDFDLNELDAIFFARVLSDSPVPNSSTQLQTKLGITSNCACIDLDVACSGFQYGFSLADSMIKTGAFKKVLVVGSEMLSRIVNWKDRSTCILFGDGCGIALLGRAEEGDTSEVLSTVLNADGTGKDFFHMIPGGAVEPINEQHLKDGSHLMQMHGREMFRVAVRTLANNAIKAIEEAGLTPDDIDWVIPHQANYRIIEAAAKRAGVSMDKVIINIEKYGNTSAATVPTTFDIAIRDGRIKRGQVILFDVFGAGLTAGANVFRY